MVRSTGAFITSILTAAGYRVGRYISPVFSYREKIRYRRINTYYITKEGMQEAIRSTNLPEMVRWL